MVEKHLTTELIQEGAKLVQGLDDAGLAPDAAFWLYSPERLAWRLVIAQVRVGPDGPRAVYRVVQKTLHSLRHEVTHLDLGDVAVAKPDAPIVGLLSKAVSTGPGISGIRFAGNMINGTLIEDSYIYRLKGAA